MKKDIQQYQLAKEMYLKGHSLTKIGSELGISRKKLSVALKNEGIGIRLNNQKHNYKEDFFKVIDTEEKAYWLGFMYADGNVDVYEKYEVRVGLAYRDIGHLYKFRDVISSTVPIREYEVKLKGKTYQSAKLCFTNKSLVMDLINKGCVPDKSLKLIFPSYDIVPSNLIRHFIRGYFDGDGTIKVNKSKKTGYMEYGVSALGTKEFLDGLQDCFSENIPGYTKTKLSSKNNIMMYSKGGKNVTRDLLNFIYKNATIYLNRKYDKYIEFNGYCMPS